MSDFDVILCPVAALPAILHDTYREIFPLGAFSYCQAYNVTGWPAGTVRCAASPEGLPIGVQVVGRPWREDVVLACLQQLEHGLGGWKPRRDP